MYTATVPHLTPGGLACAVRAVHTHIVKAKQKLSWTIITLGVNVTDDTDTVIGE